MDLNASIAIMTVLLVLLVVSALSTVLVKKVLSSAILLAGVSTVLAMVLFMSGMQLAAMMELAVSAGLVTAIFASAISLMNAAEEGGSGTGGSINSADNKAATAAKSTTAKATTAKAVATRGAASKTASVPAPGKNTRPDRSWFNRYLALPIIMFVFTMIILIAVPSREVVIDSLARIGSTTRTVLWDFRSIDILGLAFLILAGVLGVSALIDRREEK